MRRRRISSLALLGCVLAAACATPSAGSVAGARGARPAHATDFDGSRWMDANRLNMVLSNFGSWGYRLSTGDAGLCYPRGTDKSVLFASGIWFGARVDGQVRTVVGEYSQEYGPGPILPNGYADDPSRPQHVVYKVARWTGNPQDTAHVERVPDPGVPGDALVHHSWSEYMAGAVPYGAPWVTHRLPGPVVPGDSVDVPGPLVSGDLMAWSVYNDADPALHTNDAGNSAPLGLQIRQTTFAYAGGSLAGVIFLVFDVIHPRVAAPPPGTAFGSTLEDMYVSLWADPDLGWAHDDLVGCDTTQSLGYTYNATDADAVYGVTPPALGIVLLQGPESAGGSLRMTAFNKYIGGTDPNSPQSTYDYMRGLWADGTPVVDPITGQVTRFVNPGDPVTNLGWVDANSSDKRMMIDAGPFTMAPGDTQRIAAAVVVGPGRDRLSAVTDMRWYARKAAEAWRTGIEPPDEPPPSQTPMCPRPAAFWAAQCPAGSGAALTAAQLDSIAARVDSLSRLFEWDGGPKSARMCEVVSPPVPDARSEARKQYAALLANLASGVLGVRDAEGSSISLYPSAALSCPGVPAQAIWELLAQPDLGGPRLMDADYLDLVADHPVPLEGVNAGLERFNGGAGTAWSFFGGLDPFSQPDSFCSVELRFSRTATQRAYRFLRLERPDGGAPVTGRGYLYGGFHSVPFTAWDVDHDVQLDVAFVERTMAGADGTILPAVQQAATFDSTWAPDASDLGGREYLSVLRRPYTGMPRSSVATDAGFVHETLPWLYSMWVRRTVADAVIDDGDAFRFTWGAPPDTTFESLMLGLEGQPLDATVTARYEQISSCFAAINEGHGVGPVCDIETPVLVSLISAEAWPDRVELEWSAPAGGFRATLERKDDGSGWRALAAVTADGSGAVRYVDRAVQPGRRYGYRLSAGDGAAPVGEVWVDVPGPSDLALRGLLPNPANHGATVSFTLPRRAPGTLEVLDVAGRRVLSRDLGDFDAGPCSIGLDGQRPLPAGLYFIRLRHAGRTLDARGVVIR